MDLRRMSCSAVCTLLGTACSVSGDDSNNFSDGQQTATAPTSDSTGGTSGEVSDTSDGETDEDSSGIKIDLPDIPEAEGACKVADDELDAIPPCEMHAPPDSFDPELQWEWTGDGEYRFAFVTPLVANFTDDDENGEIDLCDTPDVLVNVYDELSQTNESRLYLLDGATGALHFQFEELSKLGITPAIGDIDNDGLPEVVGSGPGIVQEGQFATKSRLTAWEHDGSVKWTSEPVSIQSLAAIALADLDNDGDVEIYFDTSIFDHEGKHVWTAPQGVYAGRAVTAADLDGDDDLEIVFGSSAYHDNGHVYFAHPNMPPGGYPAIGNLDGDPEPEILLTNGQGLTLFDHDGSIVFNDLTPTGDLVGTWNRPPAILDLDGDGPAEFAAASRNHMATYEGDGTLRWTSDILDASGVASGTGFDFLGDGVAEAMIGDETLLHVFDDQGASLVTYPRTSQTGNEYPVVADVDDDGSAEIIVTSSDTIGGMGPFAPTVQVIRDVEDRWVPARRIWNQHTYHVTNVREDGTIPQIEPRSWEQLNTFRAQAQFESSGVCEPAG